MAETPMNEPSLISASDALTIAAIRGGSASFTVTASPLRNLTDSVVPSTLVISPRTRTVGAGCAHTAVAVTIKARLAMLSERRVINCISSSQELASGERRSRIGVPCGKPPVAGDIPLFLQVCLNQFSQFRGHPRADLEPKLEAPDRLMQQHSEAIGGREATH